MSTPSPPRLTLRLFGPWEAHVRGRPLPRLRTRKGEGILSVLALRGGVAVERGWLAGTLWPESSEPRALNNLRCTLVDLRHALGPEMDCLRSPTPRTLALDLDAWDVDVLTFDAAIARGDPASLEKSVKLYRGPLLEECAEPWALEERQRREQVYLAALEALAAHARSRDDLATTERYLRRAQAADPWRESVQRALMRTLAEQGSYAAAVLVYQELRLRLHQELNAEPDAATTALFQKLRAEARQKAGARPTGILTQGAAGGAITSSPHNLPAPRTSLIGRDREVQRTLDLLRSEAVRLLTLTGPPGSGKTRLGLQIAARMLPDFPQGVFFVPLAPIRDPNLVVSAIAQALGLRETGGQSLLGDLKEQLQQKEMLLLLDNFEQVIAAAPIVSELLSAASRLKVIVTSREVLHLYGEQEFPVPSLAVPPAQVLRGAPSERGVRSAPVSAAEPGSPRTLEDLAQYAAIELFVQRARNVRPDFALTHGNALAVAQICRRLEGLPLALELAAARIKLFAPQALLVRLGTAKRRGLKLLVGGACDLPARQQTLTGAIAWSYELLPEAEQVLFRRLSEFLGGCTLEAAEAVCADFGCQEPEIQNAEILELLASLLDKSLLQQEEGPEGEPRFRMLETIREFGQECLEASSETRAIRERREQFFLDWAEAAEPQLMGPEQVRWLDRLEADHDNLRSVLTWAAEGGSVEAGLRLAAALRAFWSVRGPVKEAQERVLGLLALPKAAGRTKVRARALNVASYLSFRPTEGAPARAFCEESLDISRELGDRRGTAESLAFLGWMAHIQDDHERAGPLMEQALALCREIDDSQGIANALTGLAGLAYRQGRFAEAEERLEQSIALWQKLGNHAALEHAFSNLGLGSWFRDDLAAARRHFLAGAKIARELGDEGCLQGCLLPLGIVAFQRGDLAETRTIFDELLGLGRKREDQGTVATALQWLGQLARVEGDVETARALGEESLEIARTLGREGKVADALCALGDAAAAQSDPEAARAHYQESLKLYRQMPEHPVLAKFGPRRGIAGCLEGLAKVAQMKGDPERAVRLEGAAQALRQVIGSQRAAPETVENEHRVTTLRKTLGGAAFATAWAEGQARQLDEVIQYALARCDHHSGDRA